MKAALLLALSFWLALAHAQTDPGTVSLPELLAPPLAAQEERLRADLQPRLEAGAAAGLAKTWRYLSPGDAALLGLQKNLTLRLAGRQPLLAEEALREARAVFAPVLDVTLAQSVTELVGSRSITAQISRLTFTPGACQPIPPAPGAATNGKPDVTQICFAVRGPTQQLSGTVPANLPSQTHPGPDRVTTLAVGITQQLPWGATLRLLDTSTKERSFYQVEGNWYTFNRPWASSIFADLRLPLPGTKGFGALAPAEFGVAAAKLAQGRAPWDVKTAINQILLQVDLAYWDLVQAAQNLDATMQARKLVEALAASAERRYKLETISRFDKAQADAELARARVEEEIAVRAYYIASTTLATLLEDDPRRVAESLIFPAGFSAAAEAFPRPKLEDLQQASLAMRPEIAARRIDADIAGLNLRFADNQALRDISLDLQGTRTQSAATYGYASLEDSLRHLGRPDAETTSAALTYVAPWGRRAANAAVSAARANQAAAEINHQAAEAGVILDVNDAVSAYGSALRRVENAQDALKLSEFAYGQVERRFTLGEAVSQVELNRNRRDLLAARLALISARIDVRRAESSLLAAQGTIAERYPAMHPYNDFDRHRLARLAAAGGMRFFGPK